MQLQEEFWIPNIANRCFARIQRIFLPALREILSTLNAGHAPADPDDLDGQETIGGGEPASRQPPATAEPERPTLPILAHFFCS